LSFVELDDNFIGHQKLVTDTSDTARAPTLQIACHLPELEVQTLEGI
jgi:hypothetical protein